MSGLAYFFRDHLENAPDAPADDEDDAVEAASAYQQSIAPLQQQRDDGDHSVVVQDYKEYVKEKRQELLTFLNERMVGNNSNQKDFDDGEDGQANKESKQQEEAQSDDDDQEERPETQQLDQPLLNQPDDGDDDDNSSRFAGVVPATKFPHISETSQTVSNISEIDLYCNKIQLNLCTVDKVWDFRNTKRNKKHPAKEKQYRSFLSDGPLNIIYNNVYSMEIRQCLEQPATELRKRAEQLHNINHDHTVKVFFYNEYAKRLKKLQEIARKENKKRKLQLYMAFQSIPSQCVLPFDGGAADWYETTQFVLCIGDQSNTVISNPEEDEKEYLRFDSNNMKIHCLLVDTTTGDAFAEYRIYKNGDDKVVLGKLPDAQMNGTSPIQASYLESRQTTNGAAAARVSPAELLEENGGHAGQQQQQRNTTSSQQQQQNGTRRRNDTTSDGARKRQRVPRYEPIVSGLSFCHYYIRLLEIDFSVFVFLLLSPKPHRKIFGCCWN